LSGDEFTAQPYNLDDTIPNPSAQNNDDDDDPAPNFFNQDLWDEKKTEMLPPIITIEPA
jgi:hypothetical protein